MRSLALLFYIFERRDKTFITFFILFFACIRLMATKNKTIGIMCLISCFACSLFIHILRRHAAESSTCFVRHFLHWDDNFLPHSIQVGRFDACCACLPGAMTSNWIVISRVEHIWWSIVVQMQLHVAEYNQIDHFKNDTNRIRHKCEVVVDSLHNYRMASFTWIICRHSMESAPFRPFDYCFQFE